MFVRDETLQALEMNTPQKYITSFNSFISSRVFEEKLIRNKILPINLCLIDL